MKSQIETLYTIAEEIEKDFQHTARAHSLRLAAQEIARLEAQARLALVMVRADLFYQIEAHHGPRVAAQYPSIVKADKALEEWNK